MLLAGDIGGTKTLLGLFEPGARPRPGLVREFATLDHGSLAEIVTEFLHSAPQRADDIRAAAFGVAGPVLHQTARLTNVPWQLDAATIASSLRIGTVVLLNDLEAMAHGVPVLEPSELHVLQEGEVDREGNVALVAAGTGLGEALLHRVDGRFIPSPSEAGHSDFPARNEAEIRLARHLIKHFGRAEVEQVVSGMGLANIHRVTHDDTLPCAVVPDPTQHDAPAKISKAALARSCAGCVRALEMFVDVYGAEAGNVALRVVATGGVFIGGGIAPKIMPALVDGRFLRAFRDKAPFEGLLNRVPVQVILNKDVGLLGAAVYASSLIG